MIITKAILGRGSNLTLLLIHTMRICLSKKLVCSIDSRVFIVTEFPSMKSPKFYRNPVHRNRLCL